PARQKRNRMSDTPPAPRWRLDALALTLFAAGGLLAVAVGTYGPLAGTSGPLGPYGDQLAAAVVDPLGGGAVVFPAGWFALAGLLVVTRNPVRLAVRLAGWAVLTGCAAVGADWAGRLLSPASVAGPGGSVGAFVRFQTEDVLAAPW